MNEDLMAPLLKQLATEAFSPTICFQLKDRLCGYKQGFEFESFQGVREAANVATWNLIEESWTVYSNFQQQKLEASTPYE